MSVVKISLSHVAILTIIQIDPFAERRVTQEGPGDHDIGQE